MHAIAFTDNLQQVYINKIQNVRYYNTKITVFKLCYLFVSSILNTTLAKAKHFCLDYKFNNEKLIFKIMLYQVYNKTTNKKHKYEKLKIKLRNF